jgi:serine/threonine protein phosphatase PrpC
VSHHPTQHWQTAGLTDIGRARHSNQDAFVLLDAYGCWIVADGMGGHAGGGVASRIAVDAIAASIQRALKAAGSSSQAVEVRERVLRTAICDGHQAVRREASKDPSLAGMGTTVVAVWANADPFPEATVVHVGDSRAYLCRRNALTQLTRDHSLVEEYRRRGMLSSEDAEIHPLRHVLSRALGPEPHVEPDASTVPMEPGDRLLLCTDGLTKMLTDREIARILSKVEDISATCAELVAAANRRGGDDNVTVVVVQWQG